MTFDPRTARDAATASIRDRLEEIEEQAERESRIAASLVGAYAQHLAEGGSPLEGFEVETSREVHASLIRPTAGLEDVYRLWNAARGSRNPFSPITKRTYWQLAEHALDHLGEPMLYADLREVPTSRSARFNISPSSDDIVSALAMLQEDDLVLRRTKVGGKVAYLLRVRLDSEERVGRFYENGTVVRVFASEVPEEKWNP